ncbi:hypothetical protein B0T26DRAFT_675864 [Lasiosphaeria miniovina]|uniref:Uncharacterized protein n=1 Tax=Lasiosphaeria miniovina TaxID=1954250 RepID=A0AA40AKR6_9PEZI|nr:uncharacterized protein B0T26DRAFT_675864 [Lasiosphaeria miniovina]KAK0717582.1 hypothetical protein B0T26DRAFT_675864 [Lasiosphaeria miniovina]
MVSNFAKLFAAAGVPLAAASRYTNFTTSAMIPWAGADSSGVDWESPVYLSFRVGSPSGRRFTPLADTGSQGIVLPAKYVGYDFNRGCAEQGGQPGDEYLSSSRVYYEGCWVSRTLFFNADARNHTLHPVVETHATLLAMVDCSRCLDYDATRTPHCLDKRDTRINSTGVAMLGIGFGRESSAASQATPDKNPLRNVAAIAGLPVSNTSFNAGYVLDSRGAALGLTDANTAGAAFYALQPVPYPGVADWMGPRACIVVNDTTPACGNALLDTGLNQSYVSLPNGTLPKPIAKLPDGSRVQIAFGEPGLPPVAVEEFVVGTPSVPNVNPWHVSVALRTPTFVNTGRFFYRGFSVVFDDVHGCFGLKKVESDGVGENEGQKLVVQDDL